MTLALIGYPKVEPGYGKTRYRDVDKEREEKEKDKDPSFGDFNKTFLFKGSRNGHKETSDEEKVLPKKAPTGSFDYTSIHKKHDQFLDKIRNMFRNIPTEEVKEVTLNDELLEEKREYKDLFDEMKKLVLMDVLDSKRPGIATI